MDQRALRPRRRLAPDRHPALHRVSHGKDFVVHLEGGVANAALLAGLWQRQADGAQPLQRHVVILENAVIVRVRRHLRLLFITLRNISILARMSMSLPGER
jgi:hypothetical protein